MASDDERHGSQDEDLWPWDNGKGGRPKLSKRDWLELFELAEHATAYTVRELCAERGVSPQRYYELRARWELWLEGRDKVSIDLDRLLTEHTEGLRLSVAKPERK